MSAAHMSEQSSALDHARAAAARGWRPFPCKINEKSPTSGIKWGTATAAVPTEKTLEYWFGRRPVNIGIPAKGSGLTFLDDDTGSADGMEKLCEAYGRDVPKTYRVRTSKGWHWYFATPPGVEVANAGQGSYLKDEFGFDVRGNRGGQEDAGGYVIGAGSIHETGVVYTAEDPDAEVAPLPDWLLELLLANSANKQDEEKAPASDPDRARTYTMDRANDWVLRYGINPLKSASEGGRNNALNTAAVVVGHFVPSFYTEEYAWERLTELAEEVGLESSEIAPTIRSGLRKGMSQPYALVEVDPFSSASDSAGSESDAFETEVAKKLRDLRVADEARRRLAQEQRAHRPKIGEGLIDDLDDVPEPEMMLGSLIPEESVGFLAGRSGAYKSFLATSWACCVATGSPWLARPEFAVRRPRKTLYVAAEGRKGVAGRARAWEAETGISRKGKLILYDKPIHLNDPFQVEDLIATVVENEFKFLVVDTYHRSAPGTEENSSTDFGLVFEAAAGLRDNHDCSVMFVDHTGNQKNGNPRGTSAKRDDADFVVSATYIGEEAVAGAQRELFVTKLKDEETSGKWGIKLVKLEGQKFPVVKIGLLDASDALASLGDWWSVEHCPVISAESLLAIDKAADEQRGRGRESARWVWRLLAAIDDESGLTLGEIKRMLAAAPPCEKFSEEIVKRGVTVLKKAGIVWQDGAKYGLEG